MTTLWDDIAEAAAAESLLWSAALRPAPAREALPVFSALAAPRFEPFRAADDEHGNGDGDITLDELENSPLPAGVIARPLIQTLGDRVYLQLLSEIARFQGSGECAVRSSEKRPDFGGP